MCLFVDLKMHSKTEPLVAQNDLYVWKLLLRNSNSWVTPFQKMSVEFGKLNQEEQLEPKYSILDCSVPIITRGFHAYIYRDVAKTRRDSGERIFAAKIPRGAHFFIGISGDIVSDQMVFLKRGFLWPSEEKKKCERCLEL